MKTGFIRIMGLAVATIVFVCAASLTQASTKTFPAGSYIIPQDNCWQPNKDPKMITGASYCEQSTGYNDQALFQSIGLVYDILNSGYPVYWIINPNKTKLTDMDFSITKAGSTAAVNIYHSTLSDTSSLATVTYIGGPFVIDANDIDSTIQGLFNKYANVKYHKANYDFSAEVDKVLSGTPPKVAVMTGSYTNILTNYLFASGLGNTEYSIFSYVTANQIKSDILDNYQLLWLPHWELDTELTATADKLAVLGKIRSFIEAGNAGFFECASIESMERGDTHINIGAHNANSTYPKYSYTGQGFLLDQNYTDSKGRIEENGTGLATNTLVYEHVTNVLDQCGGWNYVPVTGLTEDFRPSQVVTSPTATYVYNLNVERFIHDSDSNLVSTPTASKISYAPLGYDYFVGGHINGNATQGYVAYLGGHSYVSCAGTNVATASQRTLELWFNAALVTGTTVTLEVVYSGCTQGQNCPIAAFSSGSLSGTKSADANLYIDLDAAVYGPDADPANKFVLSNIVIGNNNSTTDFSITALNVTFDGNPSSTVLQNIVDTSDPVNPTTVCPPGAANPTYNLSPPVYTLNWGSSSNILNNPSPSSCPDYTKKNYTFTFDSALVSNTTITVEVVDSSCTAATNANGTNGTCTKGSFTTTSNTKDSAWGSNFWVDMSEAEYDAANQKLKGVTIANTSTSSKTITQINVYFANSPAAKLTAINDVTISSPGTALACSFATSPPSPAKCPAPGAPTPNPKNYKFGFTTAMATSGTYTMFVEAVFSGCTQGSTCPKVAAQVVYTSGTPTVKWTPIRNNSTVAMTMSGGTYSSSVTYTPGVLYIPQTGTFSNTQASPSNRYYLDNVTLTNLTSSDINVTAFVIDWSSSQSNKARIVYDNTAGTTIATNTGSSAVTPPQWFGSSGTSFSSTPTLPAMASTTASLGIAIPGQTSTMSLTMGKAVSSCNVNWGTVTSPTANTCGMKYVLNTLVGLQFQLIPNEYDKAGATQQDNILYKGTYEFPGFKGHLYAYDVTKNPAVKKWDAGKQGITAADTPMPLAGSANPSSPSNNNASRYIFTNVSGTTRINFDVNSTGTSTTDATKLWYYLDPNRTKTQNGVKALINSVRGRKNASDTTIAGDGEIAKRLGGIEHSTPAVMIKSDATGVTDRDRIVFAGADDGMLHAFYAGSWDSSLNSGNGGYANIGTGKEVWGYIPSTLLGSLQNEVFTDCTSTCPTFSVAVTVDGAPALGDFFLASCPTCTKSWRTVLVDTAQIMTPGSASTAVNQGIAFALDVTDPYDPSILWEQTLNASKPRSFVISGTTHTTGINYYPSTSFTSAYTTGETTTYDPNMGNAKGAAIGRVQVGTTLDTYVFLTSRWIRQVNTAPSGPANNVWGFSVYALDFYTGNVMWETKIAYTGDASNVNEAPPTPALMDYGNNGTYDYVVVGDMQGRLWILNTTDGSNLSAKASTPDAPAYDMFNGALTGNTAQPIGVAASISNNNIVFGTGARDSLTNESTTKSNVVALQISDSRGTITDLWTYELNAGEKVWSPPFIDGNGTVYIATATGYTDVGRSDLNSSSTGRLLMLNLGGSNAGKVQTDGSGNNMILNLGAAAVGDMAVENGHVTIQTVKGTTYVVGSTDTDAASWTAPVLQKNPVKVLWWRKL